MAVGAYIGVGGTARKISAIHIGINGIAQQISNGYIGIGGTAKQFFANTPYNPYLSGSITLGNTITFDNKEWTVMHIGGKYVTLGLNGYSSQGAIAPGVGRQLTGTYAESDVRTAMLYYQNRYMTSNALQYCTTPLTLSGCTTDKVFAASENELTSDWNYPKTGTSHRILAIGTKKYSYWLRDMGRTGASPGAGTGKEYAQYIDTNGKVITAYTTYNLDEYDPIGDTAYIRPFVVVQFKE